jgi:hypothetical protein
MLNCQQVTFLIERTAGRPQQVGTLMPMRVHLRLCCLCRRYQEQTLLIARVARYPQGRGPVRLREEFKAQLRAQLLARQDDPPSPGPAD